ncbi:MAG: hypothetical protein AB7P03_07695 [Kofleriaceae bacterium]
METVKIDVQKLQLLNERIAQTIDALNQVRMSMHGVQHSLPINQVGAGYSGYAPYGVSGAGWLPGMSPYQAPGINTYGVTPMVSPFTSQLAGPFGSPLAAPFVAPFLTQLASSPFAAQLSSQFLSPFASQHGSPFSLPVSSQLGSPFVSPLATPFINPFASPFAPFVSAYGPGIQHGASSIGQQQQPYGAMFGGWPTSYSNGLSNTPWDASWQTRSSVPFTATQAVS